MKISTKSRYGLRFMITLGAKSTKGMVQLSDIAREEDISEKYLSQIVIPLKNAGLVLSTRGSKGGYSIPSNYKDITVKDIVVAIEGNLDVIDCLGGDDKCSSKSSCVAVGVWNKLSRGMEKVLGEITLESLVNEKVSQEQSFTYMI